MTNANRFQVDLRGLIELLSAHLYSGPEVVVRELLQNAIDAVTMRGDRHDDPRRAVVLDASAGRLDCYDSGVGLSADDVEEFLATVGRSAKRDEWGLAREDTLGQFGIGLLSGFLVADEIHLVSRRAGGDAVVAWVAHADGRYDTESFSSVAAWRAAGGDDERAAWLAAGPGTVVRLSPRGDAVRWVDPERVRHLADDYARYARREIVVRSSDGETAIAPTRAPWELSASEREGWAQRQWHTPVLASLTVSVPEVGARAALFVLDAPVSPGLPPQHRAYVKGMKVCEGDVGVLPPWAFFVRAVVDGDLLHPTASRESLRRDDALETLSETLGAQLTRWLQRTADVDPALFRRFLDRHEVGLTSMAVAASEADFPALAALVPFETTRGMLTLDQLAAEAPLGVEWVGTIGEYRQLAPVAEAEGLVVVNGGYVHCGPLLDRCMRHERWRGLLRKSSPRSLRDRMRLVAPEREQAVDRLRARAEQELREVGVRVSIRRFEPRSVAAVLLDDASSATTRAAQQATQGSGDVFASLLETVTADADPRPELILNDHNRMVQTLTDTARSDVVRPAIQALYARALMLGRHRISAADQRTIDHAFAGLLDLAIEGDRP